MPIYRSCLATLALTLKVGTACSPEMLSSYKTTPYQNPENHSQKFRTVLLSARLSIAPWYLVVRHFTWTLQRKVQIGSVMRVPRKPTQIHILKTGRIMNTATHSSLLHPLLLRVQKTRTGWGTPVSGQDPKVCDDGMLMQWLAFWTSFSILFLF